MPEIEEEKKENEEEKKENEEVCGHEHFDNMSQNSDIISKTKRR